MRYFRREYKNNIYTFIYDKAMKYIFIEDMEELETDSIVHARVRSVNKELGYSFVDLGKLGDGFIDCELKSGEDYIFNIKKKPECSKGYVLDFDIRIKSENMIVFPNSKKFYENDYEKITDMPTLILNKNASPCELTSDAIDISSEYKKLLEIKSTLPIPKIVFRSDSKSDRFIEGYNIGFGNRDDAIMAFNDTEGLVDGKFTNDDGSIIIDSKDHFTFIDFNSDGKGVYYRRELNHLDKNKKLLKKALEIVELRNIEGMILIDLLKMNKYKRLIDELDDILKNKFVFHDITKLGILELTRKKDGRTRISQDNIGEIKSILYGEIE